MRRLALVAASFCVLLQGAAPINAEIKLASTANDRPANVAGDRLGASEDRKICNGSGSVEAWIAACTRLINSGKLGGTTLAAVHRLRGNWHQLRGEHERAILDYREALRLDPKNAQVQASLSASVRAVCLGTGEPSAIIAACNVFIRDARALPQNPNNDNDLAQGFIHRASAFQRQGSLNAAADDLASALRVDEGNSVAKRRLSELTRARKPETPPASPASPQPAPPLAANNPPPSAKVVAAAPAAAPVVATPPPAVPEIRVALVIGNGRYRHAAALPNPANDASDIAATLRKLGFEVIEGRDLDKRAMEDKVREFGRKLDRAQLALFFYAGHGMQVGGKNYLIPVDGKLERQGDLGFETIEVNQVLAQMEAEQRVNLVFLDACRDNPLTRSFARTLGTRSTSVGQGLASIQSAAGTMIAFATAPETVALDGEGRNSPFTTALLKHLSTPGLEIGAVMKRVRSDVYAVTRGKQLPWDHSALFGDVVLAR